MSFSFNGHHSDANSAAEGAPPGEVSAARLAPRVVTTGRKSTQNKPEYAGIDSETGEPVELLHSGSRLLRKSCKTLRNVWYMSACNGILTGHEAKQP